MKKICILTFEGNPIAIELFLNLCPTYDVYISYSENLNLTVKGIFSKKRGLRWYLYNHLFNWAAKRYKVSHIPDTPWKDLILQYPRSFIKTTDPNSSEHQKVLKELNPDIGVLIGTRLIHPDVYNIPENGMINLHQGHIPKYRGAPPAFWEHHFNERNMFVSVHKVVEKFDAGRILAEKKIPILGHEHFVISKFCANSYSVDLLEKSIEQVFQGQRGEKRKIYKGTNTVPGYWLLLCEYFRLLKKVIMGKFS